jgi:hypothetical protein
MESFACGNVWAGLSEGVSKLASRACSGSVKTAALSHRFPAAVVLLASDCRLPMGAFVAVSALSRRKKD